MGGVVGGGLRTSVLGVVMGGVWLEETLVMLPVGVRGVGSVVVSVGGDGWFVMTHPVTGEVIESGWVVGASGAASVDWWEVGDVVPVEVGEGEREQVFDDVGFRSNFLGHSVVGLPADVPGVLAVRSSRYAGRVVFIDPADRRVVFAADVLRLEVAGERDFSVHPPFALRVSPGGSVRHPGPGGVRIFVDHAWAGRLVVLESDRDGWVSVSDLHGGDVRVRRRWDSLVGNVAPVADERVEVVPDDVVSVVVQVGADGLVDIPGQPLVGLGYANRGVGAWDSGPGVVTLFDPHTRVVLAVGYGHPSALPPVPADEARRIRSERLSLDVALGLWAAIFAAAGPITPQQMVDGKTIDPVVGLSPYSVGYYLRVLRGRHMLREIRPNHFAAQVPPRWGEPATAAVRDWAGRMTDAQRRQRTLDRIDNPLADAAASPTPAPAQSPEVPAASPPKVRRRAGLPPTPAVVEARLRAVEGVDFETACSLWAAVFVADDPVSRRQMEDGPAIGRIGITNMLIAGPHLKALRGERMLREHHREGNTIFYVSQVPHGWEQLDKDRVRTWGDGISDAKRRLRALYLIDNPLPDIPLPPVPADVEARLRRTKTVVFEVALKLWAAIFGSARPVSRQQMVDGPTIEKVGIANETTAWRYVRALQKEKMLGEVSSSSQQVRGGSGARSLVRAGPGSGAGVGRGHCRP